MYPNKKSIFKEEKLNREFLKNGYVIVPFIDKPKIEQLLLLYKELYPEGVKGFFTTTFANDETHRNRVNDEIRKVCLPALSEYFENFKTYFSSFIVKAPGKESELILHQDMTLVDESVFTGINVWSPLVDLTPENGAIYVLPESHRLMPSYRGSSLPDIYDDVKQEVRELMQPCYLKAGEAIIFDQSIMHYSPPNLSQSERPVINTFVAHQEATILTCYWDKETEGQIELFEHDEDFLKKFENFGHNIFSRPTIGKSLGLVPYDFPKVTPEMLRKKYGKPTSKKTGFFTKLFKLNSHGG